MTQPTPIRVTVFGENFHENHDESVKAIYPNGMHEVIADGIRELLGDNVVVRTVTQDMDEHGLTDEVIATTDVLTWWGHAKHNDVDDAVVAKLQQAVLGGMGLLVLHSGHHSKIFKTLLGTTCNLRWRGGENREHVWTVNPTHPIAQGVPNPIVLEAHEMYGEFFDIPTPDDLVFINGYDGGEVFRGGCTFRRGHGKIFYFSPGDQEYPIYYHADVRKVIANGIEWVAPALAQRGVSPVIWKQNKGYADQQQEADFSQYTEGPEHFSMKVVGQEGNRIHLTNDSGFAMTVES